MLLTELQYTRSNAISLEEMSEIQACDPLLCFAHILLDLGSVIAP